MTKNKKDIHNYLNINVLPPPIREGKDLRTAVLQMIKNPAQKKERLSRYAIRLIRRLLVIADEDFVDISVQDRVWLECALSGMTIRNIAYHSNVTPNTVSAHIRKALDMLCQKFENWQDAQNLLPKMNDRVKQLESELMTRDQQIKKLTRDVESLESENSYIKLRLSKYEDPNKKGSKIVKVDEDTQTILHKRLKGIDIPKCIALKFAKYNIHTVLELVRYPDHQLYGLEGISKYAIDLVKRNLNRYGLYLGSDIRWMPSEKAYYIYPKGN